MREHIDTSVYTYTDIHAYITYIRTCIDTHMQLLIYVYVCMCVGTYVCMYVPMCECMYVPMCECMYVNMNKSRITRCVTSKVKTCATITSYEQQYNSKIQTHLDTNSHSETWLLIDKVANVDIACV